VVLIDRTKSRTRSFLGGATNDQLKGRSLKPKRERDSFRVFHLVTVCHGTASFWAWNLPFLLGFWKMSDRIQTRMNASVLPVFVA